jgi:hypothetical protein
MIYDFAGAERSGSAGERYQTFPHYGTGLHRGLSIEAGQTREVLLNGVKMLVSPGFSSIVIGY